MAQNFKRRLLSRRGQSMAEYAMLLAFVLAFIMAISGYFKTHMSGTVIAGVDSYTKTVESSMGVTVAPYAPTTTASSTSNDSQSYSGTGVVANTTGSNSTNTSTSTF